MKKTGQIQVPPNHGPIFGNKPNWPHRTGILWVEGLAISGTIGFALKKGLWWNVRSKIKQPCWV